jgi:hypothetical protein
MPPRASRPRKCGDSVVSGCAILSRLSARTPGILASVLACFAVRFAATALLVIV